MADIKRIIALIDSYLEMKGLDYVEPNEISKYLERQGVLSYSTKGQPLRKLLRDGLIPNASQPSGNRWIIRRSGNSKGAVKRVEAHGVAKVTGHATSPSVKITKGLPPIAHANSEILILGTLPGKLSLQKREYYANPGNQLWRIIAQLFNEAIPDSYMAKLSLLERRKIALWDVLDSAVRESSGDADITDGNANDIVRFVAQHPSLRIIGFNGKKTMNLFREHTDISCIPAQIRLVLLPSTSPTNTHSTLEEKIASWKTILE